MAVIGKIRENSTLLLIIIGGALMAFILTDLFSSRSSVFQEDRENIGSIDGKNIKSVEFNVRFEHELENFKARENRTDVPEFVQGQLRDQVWNQYLNEMIMGEQLEKLGVVVSSEELADMTYGDNPHDQVKQAFTNPNTGQFSKNDVINFLKNMENDEEAKTQWLVFEKAMKRERRSNKYYTLIKKGLYATGAEVKQKHSEQTKQMSFAYIVKRYTELTDSLVDLSESDIEEYYNNHPNEFMEKKSRKIEYVAFDIAASSEDSTVIKEWVNETFAKFKTTRNDSSFVNANSDREFDFRYYSKNDENLRFDTSLFKADSVGYTTEPKIENEKWKMSKISKIKYAPDSVEARHILLAFEEGNEEEVNKRIDSLMKAIEEGADFGELAAKFSQDPGSKDKKGSLGWFKEGFMIPVINDSCFNAKTNRLMKVESPFGIHLLEVLQKSPEVKKLQVAQLVRGIDASRETIDKIFTASNDFSIQVEDGAEMESLAPKFGVLYNTADVRENDNMIGQLESSRGIVRWAYEAELNQVSEALQYGGSFVVVKLLEIHEDGVAPLSRVEDEARIGAMKDKKAEIFKEEMSGFTDINDAAQSLDLTVDRAANVVFEAYSIPNLGRELHLLGRIFTMSEGDLSVPIQGENGVYIVHIEKVVEPNEISDTKMIREQIAQGRESRVDFEVFEALKKRVEIEDYRFRFY